MSRFRFRIPGSHPIRPLLLFLVATGLAGCGREGRDPPNLVLISAERLAADRLGCFGGAEESGRSVCRLGKQGTLFGWTMTTGAGVASAAASMLTGLPASAHSVEDDGLSFLDDHYDTLAETLSRVGYTTAAFIESPVLNRSRRLNQGFDLYDDYPGSESELSEQIQKWMASNAEPYFLWIQLGSETSLPEIDRLVARLDTLLDVPRDGDEAGTGILFTALRGVDSDPAGGIRLETHRIALIWRAPARNRPPSTPPVSFGLASLMDVFPTLVASAGVPMPTPMPENTDAAQRTGRRLETLDGRGDDRFLLLEQTAPAREIGIASGPSVYVRDLSPFDSTDQTIPPTALAGHAARFLVLHFPGSSDAKTARLPEIVWRRDVLSTDSPVPRLEFHLSRRLRKRTGKTAPASLDRVVLPTPGLRIIP